VAKKRAGPNGEAKRPAKVSDDSAVARKSKPGGPIGPGGGRRRELLPVSEFTAALGSRIRALRIKRGLTLEQAAERTGGMVTLSSWSGYECGASEPKLSNALAVCRALRVRLEKLVPRTGRPAQAGKKKPT
jgi:DNA-binding XRE family transcriptional regulator